VPINQHEVCHFKIFNYIPSHRQNNLIPSSSFLKKKDMKSEVSGIILLTKIHLETKKILHGQGKYDYNYKLPTRKDALQKLCKPPHKAENIKSDFYIGPRVYTKQTILKNRYRALNYVKRQMTIQKLFN
jgi:hypothetical protein